MVAQGAGRGGASDDRDDIPSIPEEVWRKFLADSEPAIRASAPREPSARERAPGRPSPPPVTDETTPRARRPYVPAAHDETDAVGELWQPEDAWTGPKWREPDGRGRLRRVGRALGTAAAITLALAAWAHLPTGTGGAHQAPDETSVGQPEGTSWADRPEDQGSPPQPSEAPE